MFFNHAYCLIWGTYLEYQRLGLEFQSSEIIWTWLRLSDIVPLQCGEIIGVLGPFGSRGMLPSTHESTSLSVCPQIRCIYIYIYIVYMHTCIHT